MSKRVLRVSLYILLLLLLAQCSGANFGGGGNDAQSGSNTPQSIDGPTSEPADAVDEPNPTLGDLKVYQTSLINGGLSFATVDVDLNIEDSDSPILLFIHLLQPTVIHLTGDVEAVQAVFLTANTNLYDLPTSRVLLPSGAEFPSNRVATGFLPDYNAGVNVDLAIGSDNVDQWVSGVEISNFANSLGARKCFDLAFDTDFDSDPQFSVKWASGQTCFY